MTQTQPDHQLSITDRSRARQKFITRQQSIQELGLQEAASIRTA